ncbi:SIMPL domain-containing protein [Luteirhabdus pelagi]|uniref:SIMPL domain-containing protein n=1 Tax=Luteirhabdus pelagi TaxID=2792783 RepID=UPI00193A047F|nr:SIMPL domain-containing protein [Luteirhabdus pelagi]
MCKFKFLAILIIVSNSLMAQVAGNINYQTQTRYSDNNITVGISNDSDLNISVKGLANIEADNYVAIFNITQLGETTKEVNELLDSRVNSVINKISSRENVETYVDMVSFVPVYEFEVDKKIFSKNTYNEIPVGFELKKNLHVRYKDPNFLNELISICTGAEIYDLVRVDYFSDQLEKTKSELMKKAKTILTEKIANYQGILGVDLNTFEKQLSDGYKVVYPVEMYKSYQAYSSSSLNLKRSANVNQSQKSTTLYYQPIIDKEFDFVVNPTVLEPVIQVMYEIRFRVNREKEEKASKEYILVTPNGDLKTINIGN